MVTIYKITHKHTGKAYIGQTKRFKERMSVHRQGSENGLLAKDIKKFGKNEFLFEPLAVVEDAMADEMERKAISVFQTLKPGGYNSTIGKTTNKPKKGPSAACLARRAKKKEAHEYYLRTGKFLMYRYPDHDYSVDKKKSRG